VNEEQVKFSSSPDAGISMPASLAGETAIITGGSRGIGFAVAEALAKLGVEVLIISQNSESLTKAITKLTAQGFKSNGFQADVSNATQMEKVGAEILNKFIPTILVNSAGVMSEKTAKTLKTTSLEWQRVMGINLEGVFNSVRIFAPVMVEKRKGRIINLSACLGRFSGPGTNGGLAPYRISKTGVNALTKNFAAETGNGTRGILVDAVCPGHCQTDMGGPLAPRTSEKGAETVLWLASREMTNGIQTGLLWEDKTVVPW